MTIINHAIYSLYSFVSMPTIHDNEITFNNDKKEVTISETLARTAN